MENDNDLYRVCHFLCHVRVLTGLIDMQPNYNPCKVETVSLCCLETAGFMCQERLVLYTVAEIIVQVFQLHLCEKARCHSESCGRLHYAYTAEVRV